MLSAALVDGEVVWVNVVDDECDCAEILIQTMRYKHVFHVYYPTAIPFGLSLTN
jgi:hypothetical protein